jgi:hypothetical protein
MEDWAMKKKILGYSAAFGTFLLCKVLPFDLGVIALVGLSFLIWGGFAWAAFSERLVWSGIGMALVAGILISGQTIGGRTYGIPTYTAALSSNLIEWNIEIRRQIEERFDFRMRLFLIGLIAFLAGVVVDSMKVYLGG